MRYTQRVEKDIEEDSLIGNEETPSEEIGEENDEEFTKRKIELPIEFEIPSEITEDDDFPLLREIEEKQKSDVRAFDIVEASLAFAPEAKTESSKRFAVVNHDFNIVSVKELFVMFQSMCGNSGKVAKISQFYSKFGEKTLSKDSSSVPDLNDVFLSNEALEIAKVQKQREMDQAYEQKKKKGDIKKKMTAKLTKREKVDTNKVVLYEMEKLKYFIGVVEFTSASAMLQCYDSCNGVDIGDTQAYLDLRIIEEDKSFDDYVLVEEVKNVDLDSFQPVDRGRSTLYNQPETFQWDMQDQARKRVLTGAGRVPDEEILKYINLSDEDDDDDEEEIARIRRILLSKEDEINEEEGEGEEFDEGDGDEEMDKFEDITIPVFDTEENMEIQKKLNVLLEDKRKSRNETYHETRKRRKREEKKLRQKELRRIQMEGAMEEEEEENDADFEHLKSLVSKSTKEQDALEFDSVADRQREMQRIQKRNEEGRDTGFNIDLSGRFEKLLTDPDFNIDPTSKKFRKTKNYETIVKEKLKRKRERDEEYEKKEYPTKKQKTE